MYEITEEQRQEIIRLLGEIPSKYSFDLIGFFAGMKKKEDLKEEFSKEE